MLFVDYVFEKVFNNIRFDKDLNPSLLDIKSGDKFVAHVDEDNRLTLVRVIEESK
jgi:hypothetical protein